MGVLSEHFATPFAVELSKNPETSEASICKYFSTLEEAQTYIEQQKGRFPAVWLSRIGSYITRTGSEKTDWIYFWWSEIVEWGQPTQGMGYPFDHLSEMTSYVPYELPTQADLVERTDATGRTILRGPGAITSSHDGK